MSKNNQENNEDIYNMQTTWRILNSSPRSPLLTDSKLKEKKKRFKVSHYFGRDQKINE